MGREVYTHVTLATAFGVGNSAGDESDENVGENGSEFHLDS